MSFFWFYYVFIMYLQLTLLQCKAISCLPIFEMHTAIVDPGVTNKWMALQDTNQLRIAPVEIQECRLLSPEFVKVVNATLKRVMWYFEEGVVVT